MTPEDFARLRSLYDHAAALPPDECRAFVESNLAEADPLRSELVKMLEARVNPGFPEFLERPIPPTLPVTEPAGIGQPLTGQVGGRYRILKELGHGGMGVVYLAVRNDDVFSKTVALKVIGSVASRASFVERFKRERQILAGLDHPNIARILDGGNIDDGRPYYVMEYVDGKPLVDYCTRIDADVPARLELILAVCEALEHMHTQGIVHRDIKPSNILVTANGRVKLLDFGIARTTETEWSGTGPQTIVATPGYASPEQMAGEDAGRASDIYSLGVVLYELLTGRLPFVDAHGRPSLGAQNAADEPKPPSHVGPGSLGQAPRTKSIRPDLDRIVQKVLQREPLRRYQSVGQLAEDLRRYLAGRPIGASGGSSHVLRLWLARNPVPVVLVVLLLLSAGAGTWFAVSNQMDRIRLEAKEGEVERLVAMLNQRVDRWRDGDRMAPQSERVQDVRTAGEVVGSRDLAELSVRSADPPRLKRLIEGLRRFLDRADEMSKDEPSLRKEVALVYRQVGDFVADTTRPLVADKAQAAQSYRRAASVAASVRGAEPAWAGQQIAALGQRLSGLGETLPADVVRGPEPVTEAEPVVPPVASPPLPRRTERDEVESDSAPSAPVQSAPAPQPAPVTPTPTVDPERYADIRDRLRGTAATASRLRQNLEDLTARLAVRGQALRGDLTAGMSQIDGLIDQATKSLESGDLDASDELLNRLTYELRRLRQSVGS